jgi:hypothetical protein
MEYPLYKNENSYYLIINKAINYNIALEFTTFSTIIISNEKLAKYSLIEFNEENLNDFGINNLIIFDNKIYQFNNWLDVFNYYKRFKNNL